MKFRSGKTRNYFPWHSGNRFQLLVDGEHFFPRMLQAIDAAQHYVLLEMYLFESGRIAADFIAALCAAAARGSKVYVLLDDYGARNLNRADRQRLHNAGISLGFYNPLRYGALRRNLWRDHRKLLLVDGQWACVGGAGITDEFSADEPSPKPQHWHDVMLEIRGPCVGDWQQLFTDTWNAWMQPPLELQQALPASMPENASGRVSLNEPTHGEIKRTLVKRVRNAERRVWIATAYFIPSWKIRRALRYAVRSGADVRLLLPGPHTDHPAVRHAGRRYYAKLLAAGVRIFEYQPRFLHAKVLLCDNWLSIGSSNIDRWNLSWNLEANQEIDDQGLAEQTAAWFEEDFSQSREFHTTHWHRRSLPRRLQEWFWGQVELWLERLSRGRGRGPDG